MQKSRLTLYVKSIRYTKGGYGSDWVEKGTLADDELEFVRKNYKRCRDITYHLQEKAGSSEAYWLDPADAQIVVGNQVFHKESVQLPGQLVIWLAEGLDTPAAMQRQFLLRLAQDSKLRIADPFEMSRRGDTTRLTILGTPAELTRFLARVLPSEANLCLAEKPHTHLMFRRGAPMIMAPSGTDEILTHAAAAHQTDQRLSSPDGRLIQLLDLNVQTQTVVLN